MIVKLQGGLGNQMFQYAYGATEAQKRKESLSFDTTLLEIGEPRRKYELGAFMDVPIKNSPDAEEGYWQAEKYFLPHIARSAFYRPKGPIPAEVLNFGMKMHHACFVGVRRADYLWPERIGFHGVMPREYYTEAMSRFPRGTKFFAFSDDPEWTRDNLGMWPIRTTPAWDIWLMSLCNHAIIANSSFHWWGAWLGPDRSGTVIAPKKWFVNEKSEIVPERWITL